MTWSRSDHHPRFARMTWSQSDHHGGFAAMTSELRSDHSMIVNLWGFTRSLSISNKMLRKLVLSHIIWQDYCIICNSCLYPLLWDNLIFASIAYRKAKLIYDFNEEHIDIKERNACFSMFFGGNK
jgi:hypothetical protein